MRSSSKKLWGCSIIWTALIFTQVAIGVGDDDKAPMNFGHPFFTPEYFLFPTDGGDIYLLYPHDASILNLEHSGDLLQNDLRLFHPDLVSAGREVFLSSLGAGVDYTRLLWRDRPFRNARNCRADFNLIPLKAVGGVRSTHFGVLKGLVSPGATVDFQPLNLKNEKPLTTLYHRVGFYDFAPAEFIHSRRAGQDTYMNFGGFFPSSRGRFAHARVSGHTLHGEMSRSFGPETKFTGSVMSILNRVDIPFTDVRRSIHRNDIDLKLSRHQDDQLFEISGYRVVCVRSDRPWTKENSRESGVVMKTGNDRSGFHLRLSQVAGMLPEGSNYDLAEFEAGFGIRRRVGRFSWSMMFGGMGWWPHRVKHVGAINIDTEISETLHLYFAAKRSVDPHSPEVMFADYNTSRPVEEFIPTWKLNPDLPITGGILPVTTTRGVKIGIEKRLPLGSLNLSVFGRKDVDFYIWAVSGDSVISPVTRDNRITNGWQSSWKWSREPFRAGIGLLYLNQEFDSLPVGAYEDEEPSTRANWEVGWHNTFWNNDFETDLVLSGKYFSSFEAYGINGKEKIGGAYPVDIRFTARIRRFTLFYGLHNLNSYQYYLVPGYKMIHREEYWGIDWLLIN